MITLINKNKNTLINNKAGETILNSLALFGESVHAPCGGAGKCGKCKVKLVSGSVINAKVDEDGFCLACRAVPNGDISIMIPTAEYVSGGENISKEILTDDGDNQYKLAIDIGTTTLAVNLIKGGKIIDFASGLNAQKVFGADVISRINAAADGNLHALNNLIINQLKTIISGFKNKYNFENIFSAAVSANTVMLHIFANENPQTIGVAPYKPLFTACKRLNGAAVNLPAVKSVTLLPSLAGYLGADLVAGAASKSLHQNDAELLIDVGTNGEMALSYGGKIFCSSTATGPALEGAEIACGSSGTLGAIDHVSLVGGNISFTTIGNKPASGICGSGLIDAVAALLELQRIDDSGYLEDDYYFTDKVYVCRKDIRQFQLAKSAIASGINLLSRAAGISLNDIKKVYITGGLGFYLNVQSAIKVGMLPREFDGKIEVCPNLSLHGASVAVTDDSFINKCEQVIAKSTVVELASYPDFMDLFTDNMSFEEN